MAKDFDSSRVLNGLHACLEGGLQVFGSDAHHFRLNPRLSLKEVEEFELKHSICLPIDYRTFLLEVGNGGAGPYYGVFPLGLMDDDWDIKAWGERDGFVGVLKEPFPHNEPWNDVCGMPDDDLSEKNPDEHERLTVEFEQRYWNPALVNGAIPICHMGCALRVWLIVSGKESGHLWRDARTEFSGLQPIVLKDGSSATFSSWYLEWLEDCLQLLNPPG